MDGKARGLKFKLPIHTGLRIPIWRFDRICLSFQPSTRSWLKARRDLNFVLVQSSVDLLCHGSWPFQS
jgi:hypothetical protein